MSIEIQVEEPIQSPQNFTMSNTLLTIGMQNPLKFLWMNIPIVNIDKFIEQELHNKKIKMDKYTGKIIGISHTNNGYELKFINDIPLLFISSNTNLSDIFESEFNKYDEDIVILTFVMTDPGTTFHTKMLVKCNEEYYDKIMASFSVKHANYRRNVYNVLIGIFIGVVITVLGML